MHRKFWVDEFYSYTVLAFTRGTAKFMYWIDDVWGDRPPINALGRHRSLALRLSARFDRYVIDGIVNAVAWVSDCAGSVLREHPADRYRSI
jgi:hypothetical protein